MQDACMLRSACIDSNTVYMCTIIGKFDVKLNLEVWLSAFELQNCVYVCTGDTVPICLM